MRLPNAEAPRPVHRYLRLLQARELSVGEKQTLIADTAKNYAAYYNRGFLTYRK